MGGSLSLTIPRALNDYPPDPQIVLPRAGGSTQDFRSGQKRKTTPPRAGGSHSKISMTTTRDYPPDYLPVRGVVTGEIMILQNFRLRRYKINVNSLYEAVSSEK